MAENDAQRLNIKKNVIFSVAAFCINVALVFLSYRLLIQQSGLEAVGLWSSLYAWTVLIRLGDAGMTNASLRFIALCDPVTERPRQQAYLQTGIIANIILFVVLGLVGYSVLLPNLGDLVGEKFAQEARDVLPVMMSGFVLLNISGVIIGSLQGFHRGYIGSQLGVAGNLVQIVAVLLLVPGYGIVGLAWAQIIQYSATIVVAWLFTRSAAGIKAPLPLAFSLSAFREMLAFSLKAQVANIANGLFEPGSKIIVSHFGGLQMLGIYELAYKTLWLPRNAVVGGVSAMIPALTNLLQHDPARVWPLYAKSVRYATALVALVCIGAVIGSPVVSWLWLGYLEWDYTIYIAILSLGVLASAHGAAAYNLGTISGNMNNNIVVNIATIAGLALVAVVFTLGLNLYFLVLSIALVMAVQALVIKRLNDTILLVCGPKE